MKQLTCELCGSNDLIKQDGVFVCQSCGCKYSVEEAKKLISEGTVEAAGEVKYDPFDDLSDLYPVARSARDVSDNENAAKYYGLILMNDPSSWEANFYTVYLKSMSCKVNEISASATALNNCIETTLFLIKNNITAIEERISAVTEIKERSFSLSDILFNAASNQMDSIDPLRYRLEHLSNISASLGIKKEFCNKLCKIFDSDEEIMSTIGIKFIREAVDDGADVHPGDFLLEQIKKYDPGYEPPKPKVIKPPVQNTVSNKNGCYVATCVYGSYDCPQVWTLRRFRDNTLSQTLPGRAFIRIYYTVSPTLVKWFGNTSWFKKMWKGTLDRMVAGLQANGVEATPYQDTNWRLG